MTRDDDHLSGGKVKPCFGPSFRPGPEAMREAEAIAGLPGVSSAAVFPDLRLSRDGVSGIAVVSKRLYPFLAGADVGCGLSLFMLDLPVRKVDPVRFARSMRALREPWRGDASGLLKEAGLPPGLHSSMLGSLGGGSHFCELQSFTAALDGRTHPIMSQDTAYLLVHSGSRSFGGVVASFIAGAYRTGIEPDSEGEVSYMAVHDVAVRWASLNRRAIALRVAAILGVEVLLACDVPHNLIERVDGQWLHRKGTSRAVGGLVPVAGSRSGPSYLVAPAANIGEALFSLPHAAAARQRHTVSAAAERNRALSGGAGAAVDEVMHLGMASPVVLLTPLATYQDADDP